MRHARQHNASWLATAERACSTEKADQCHASASFSECAGERVQPGTSAAFALRLLFPAALTWSLGKADRVRLVCVRSQFVHLIGRIIHLIHATSTTSNPAPAPIW
eukprot:scaffold196267_cov32-Tisochrysis_lutea.AAC.11